MHKIGDIVVVNFMNTDLNNHTMQFTAKIIGINKRTDEVSFVGESYDLEFADGYVVQDVSTDKLLRLQ